ncbi:collagen alpha-6(VI) chain-like [Haliotis rufescens]|uniref:collagen alpha-6(VI) chain-like n=1 Tax=Haliotis rufescens TaxID=6454 RepID=UPI00201ED2B6|nr:collagen alpha-6(VI) chain-like [Haliotis rufescens]
MRLATWTLATAWMSLLCITSTTSQGTKGCSGAYTAYVVVDGSESISNSGFEEVRNALITFADQSIRSNSLTKVGVVLYSDDVTAVITASSDINSLVNAIRMLAHPNSGTFTHLGIWRAKGLLDADTSGNNHIMIVMTDGLSNFPADTKAAAAETKNAGIRVIAVGVNPLLNFPSSPYKRRYEQELVDIASDNATAIQIEDFSSLVTTVQDIVQSLCRRDIGCSGAYTAYVVVDGSESISNSSFEEVRNALITFADQSIRSNSLTKVGVVLYSDDVTAVITASSDINSLVNAIRMLAHPNSGTFTHLGIRRAKGLLDADTSGNNHIMIVMTDGLSNFPADTKAAAAETKNAGIRVIAVGVNPLLNFPSSPYKSRYEQELVDIASDNATAIQIEDFSNLVVTVENIVQSLCRDIGKSFKL